MFFLCNYVCLPSATYHLSPWIILINYSLIKVITLKWLLTLCILPKNVWERPWLSEKYCGSSDSYLGFHSLSARMFLSSSDPSFRREKCLILLPHLSELTTLTGYGSQDNNMKPGDQCLSASAPNFGCSICMSSSQRTFYTTNSNHST